MTAEQLARYTLKILESTVAPQMNAAQKNELYSEREEHKRELARMKAAYELKFSETVAAYKTEIEELRSVVDALNKGLR